MQKNLVIAGAGDFGREVAALVRRINLNTEEQYNLLGFVDDSEALQGKTVGGLPVLGKTSWLNEYDEELCVVCSVGTGRIRKKIIEKINNPKIIFPNLVDPSVIFLGESKWGEGAIICANNVISVDVTIGNHAIINLACTLGHDDVVGDYCTINPGVNVSGCVILEPCADIGTGTKLIQHVTVGSNSVVGAGTVVIKDVEPDVTVVGNPARIVKRHSL